MRVNPNEIEKYENSTNTEWFTLPNDGDVARVQFMYHNYNDLDTLVVHKEKVGNKERFIDCKRSYDDPIDMCPLCAAGNQAKPVLFVFMYDLNDKKVKIWQRGRIFREQLEGLFNRYGDLTQQVFEIERHGAKGDMHTKYQIYPMPNVQPVDISEIEKPELIGGLVMDKTPDEMQVFVETGSFPPADGDSNNYSSRGNNEDYARRSENTVSRRQPVSRRGEEF